MYKYKKFKTENKVSDFNLYKYSKNLRMLIENKIQRCPGTQTGSNASCIKVCTHHKIIVPLTFKTSVIGVTPLYL